MISRNLARFSSAELCAVLGLLVFCICGPVPLSRAQSPQGHSPQLTVEDIFAPGKFRPKVRFAQWAPGGQRLSYLHPLGEGVVEMRAELLVMDAATGAEHVLVTADKLSSLLEPPKSAPSQRTGLGRRQPQSYFWAPDGNALLFASEGQLVWLDLPSMASRTLVKSEQPIADPKISPDGRWVSYLLDSNVWIVSSSGGPSKQLTHTAAPGVLEGELDWVYPEELDLSTAYWWSPDSSRLAYLQMDERPVMQYPLVNFLTPSAETEQERYPEAGTPNPVVNVGVVPVAGGPTKWISLGANRDIYVPRVNWLPDGQRLAIQRLNRAQTQLDLLFADPADGAARVILTERDNYWINLSDDLYFFHDGRRFLWSSERSGHRHLYLYDISGKLLEPLTQGDWDVTGFQGFGPGSEPGLVVNEPEGYVYFLSNKNAFTGSYLYRLSLRDKNLTQITAAEGTHFVALAPGAHYFLDTYSTTTTPPRQDLDRADGSRIAVLSDGAIPALSQYRLSPPQFVTVRAADGAALQAEITKPPDFDPSRKYPVLVDVYGGPRAQMVVNAWRGAGFLWQQMMAQKGFIIWTLDNRGSFGRGHVFETPIYHHFGAVELQDQIAGVNYLKSLPYVDAAHIGIYGGSYGGYMTLLALLRAGDVFQAGFAAAPVTDWRLYDTIYTERYMGTPQENPQGYQDSSPIAYARGLRGHLFIAHGTGDDNVHFANTVELQEKFIEADKFAELAIYPGRGHGISDPTAQLQLYQHVTQFFLKYLLPSAPAVAPAE